MGPSTLAVPAHAEYHLQGYIQPYVEGITNNWLLVAPDANPAMLEMFRDRDRLPHRDLVPWAGEFAGKYLISACQVLQLTQNPALKKHVAQFVERLMNCQDTDGYLGPWPREHRLDLVAPNSSAQSKVTWDTWSHSLLIIGLLLWHEMSGDGRALERARLIGDMVCDRFLHAASGARIVDKPDTEMNLALVHGLSVLYHKTRDQRHLDLALQLIKEFEATDSEGRPLAGDYLSQAQAGKEFYEIPKPRWESIHCLLALPELYPVTGSEEFRRAFEHYWWSIVKLDRHNNGGFSSGERAQGNPYHPGAIESCCTIAWLLMSVEMLKLTGNPVVADELELTLLNSGTGMHHPSGRWATYSTPMDGVRKASAHEIVFQAREGAPELNCCSVNTPRCFGLIPQWAVMRAGEGLAVNWYGPGTISTALDDGTRVDIVQDTDYPRSGAIDMTIGVSAPKRFPLNFRIPHWSKATTVALNGRRMEHVPSGTYLCVERLWEPGDRVTMQLDFSLHYWYGEQECEHKVSIYRGPILLTYDRSLNQMDPHEIPVIDVKNLPCHRVAETGAFLEVDLLSQSGLHIRLCDFGSAGATGAPYVSWLPAANGSPTDFSSDNPLRSRR